MELTPTTTLDAVNLLLNTIGELSINTLEECTFAEATTAMTALNRVSRNVQTTGLHCNSEEGVRLMPNTEGIIEVPSNTLMADPSDITLNITLRGRKLYDKENHTYLFKEAIELDILYFLPFEELPEHVRWYISVRAARQYQAQILGADAISRYTENDEVDAFREFRRIENLYDDSTMLDHPTVQNALRRTF